MGFYIIGSDSLSKLPQIKGYSTQKTEGLFSGIARDRGGYGSRLDSGGRPFGFIDDLRTYSCCDSSDIQTGLLIVYNALDDIRRANVLNLTTKGASTPFGSGKTVLPFIQSIIDIRGDRFFAFVPRELRGETKHGEITGLFSSVPGLEHLFQVIEHSITGIQTHPYAVHAVLILHRAIDPEYSFVM